MWTVLEHYTARQHQSSDTDLSFDISVSTQVTAFFRLMPQLPSSAIVTCRQSPRTKVHGLAQLRNAVTSLARNMSDVFILPLDLTLHLVLTLASLPVDVEEELRQFLTDCPLVTLSAMVHTATVGSAVNLARSRNHAVGDVLEAIHSAVDEASTLPGADAESRPCPSSVPAWLRGAALWHRLHNTQYSTDVSNLICDGDTAEALLHCLTLDIAAGILRGDSSRQKVEDSAVAVWLHHISSLHCLSDCNQRSSPTAAAFRRCAPDLLQRMQSLACLSVSTRATRSRGLAQLLPVWDIGVTLNWYIRCADLYDSGRCTTAAVMTLLEQSAAAIGRFAAEMPQSQLRAIDQATLDAVDPHVRIMLQQLRNA